MYASLQLLGQAGIPVSSGVIRNECGAAGHSPILFPKRPLPAARVAAGRWFSSNDGGVHAGWMAGAGSPQQQSGKGTLPPPKQVPLVSASPISTLLRIDYRKYCSPLSTIDSCSGCTKLGEIPLHRIQSPDSTDGATVRLRHCTRRDHRAPLTANVSGSPPAAVFYSLRATIGCPHEPLAPTCLCAVRRVLQSARGNLTSDCTLDRYSQTINVPHRVPAHPTNLGESWRRK